jgi:hypothetical protein
MLNKLMKHEFRATGRIMGPLYLVMAALALCANGSVRLLDTSHNMVLNILGGIVMAAFILSIFAVCIITLVVMVNRFRTNLLGDEGYVMFTLPASVHQQIWSKLLVSCVWFIASGAAVLLSLAIAAFDVEFMRQAMDWLSRIFREITGYYAINGAAFLVEALVLMFASCAAGCLLFYAAMAVGHSFAGHKTLLSVAFFLLFQFALQFLGMTGIMGLDGVNLFQIWNLDSMGAIHAVMGLGIAASVAEGAIFYVITAVMLKKHLNLE